MVAVEDREYEIAVDRPAVLGLKFRQLLLALRKGRGAFAGPDHRIQRQASHELRMTLCEQGGTQSARRNPVYMHRLLAAQLLDVSRRRETIIGALRDRRII